MKFYIPALEARLAELERPVPGLPRVFLLESEYMAAVVRAQIKWLRAVTADLRSRRLTWSEQSLRRFAAEWAAEADPSARPPRRRAVSKAPSTTSSRTRARKA